eukprot:symbB.v1.2.029507.t1/scaffold3240.1/size60461/2
MLTLGGASMTEAFVVGKEAAQLVSAAFGAPVKMEFEKVYFPFLLMNKKRYAGLAFGAVEDKGKLDFKGIEVVRRDWCLLVRHMVEHSLHLLLRERSKERAVAYVRESVTALRSGKVDFRLLVISKALVRDGVLCTASSCGTCGTHTAARPVQSSKGGREGALCIRCQRCWCQRL